MINEKKFNEVLKSYNRDMNIIRAAEQIGLTELQLRQALTSEIVAENNDIEFNLVPSRITYLLQKEDYRTLHTELQKVFKEFIPLSTIRRFIKKCEQYGVEFVCILSNKYKNNFGYSDTMCKIHMSDLLVYLADTEEERVTLAHIYTKFDSDWDRLTEYRKSRIKRGKGQLYLEILNNLVYQGSISFLQDKLQKMFNDFIHQEDVIDFVNKAKNGLNIDKLLNLHKSYCLEQFSNLMLVI